MIFNSLEFGAFAAGLLLLLAFTPRAWRNTLLLLASYVFYGAWDARFLSLILLSTAFIACREQPSAPPAETPAPGRPLATTR